MVRAQITQGEHGVLAALDVVVLGEASERDQWFLHQLLVVGARDSEVGQDEKTVAHCLVIRTRLGVKGEVCLSRSTINKLSKRINTANRGRQDGRRQVYSNLAHDGFENVAGEHFWLVSNVGSKVAKSHGSHALALLVVRTEQRDQVWLHTSAQNRVTVFNVRTQVAQRTCGLALHERR